MIKGMTGYGSHVFSLKELKGVVEIRSQNHRYLDITYFLPAGFNSFESKLRALIEKRIERGRVSVSVKITHKPAPTIILNKETIKQYLKYAKSLKKEFNLGINFDIAELLKLPGVMEVSDVSLTTEAIWPALEKAVHQCLKSLANMRKTEGKSLARDITDKLKKMSLQTQKIKERAKVILAEKRKILTEEEWCNFQNNIDINEETSRLVHYIDEFKGLIKTDASVGKKMDFVAQEMQRETNTIGSKLQDKFVSNAVIAIKSKIEKLREQSQNIE